MTFEIEGGSGSTKGHINPAEMGMTELTILTIGIGGKTGKMTIGGETVEIVVEIEKGTGTEMGPGLEVVKIGTEVTGKVDNRGKAKHLLCREIWFRESSSAMA